jgi:uncharacterized membrane protein
MRLDLKELAARLRAGLWFDPLLGAVAGIALACLALAGERLDDALDLPDLGAGPANTMLQMIAGGMLTVITVSFSAMLVVVGSVGSNASPRAAPALIADPVAHHALAVFVAAFAFAVAGLALLAVAIERPAGRGMLFIVGVVVLAYALATLIAWIHHAAGSLRLSAVIARLHAAGVEATGTWRADPLCGAAEATGSEPPGDPVMLEATGWLRRIDVTAIAAAAERNGVIVTILHRPGAFVHPGRSVAVISGGVADEACREAIRGAFAVGIDRTHEQDPLLALALLGEVGRRALSPGINDPGTAIECLNYGEDLLLRALAPWRTPPGPAVERVRMVPLVPRHFLEAAVSGIARDGRDFPEVTARVQAILASLAVCVDDATRDVVRHIAASLPRPGEGLSDRDA